MTEEYKEKPKGKKISKDSIIRDIEQEIFKEHLEIREPTMEELKGYPLAIIDHLERERAIFGEEPFQCDSPNDILSYIDKKRRYRLEEFEDDLKIIEALNKLDD